MAFKAQVEDDALKDYFMQVQLHKMGDQLKASVKEEVMDTDQAPMDGLGWGMDAEAAGAMAEEEEEYHDEELEEEDMAEDQDHDSWTAKDWEHVGRAGAKALGHDGVVDVDKWDDEMKMMKGRWEQPAAGWKKVKAPWASKPPSKSKQAWLRKTDRWGGECWSDGWYKDKTGKWWP